MRLFVLYTKREVQLEDLHHSISQAVRATLLWCDGELHVESPSSLPNNGRLRYVTIYKGEARYEPEEDLALIPFAKPNIFIVHFDSFILLKQVLLAVTDAFDLWIANNDQLDPTPGSVVAARIRSDPSWNLDHSSVLPE